MNDIDDIIERLIATMGEDNPDLASFIPSQIIRKHITHLVKTRTMVITGISNHLTVEDFANKYANVDAPKKYDWQADSVSEDEFMYMLEYYSPSHSILTSEIERVKAAIRGDEWFSLPKRYSACCADCAEPLYLKVKGNEVQLVCDVECTNNRVFTVEIDFPTGEVVYDDWPNRFSEARNAGFIYETNDSVNYIVGQRSRTDGMATQQILHHSVGNTSPDIYINPTTNEIQVGTNWIEDKNGGGHPTPEGYVCAGYVCTDLWWVTMLDKQFYDSIIAKLPSERDEDYYEKIVNTFKVAPGRYRFTCYALESDETPFITAERIGDVSGSPPPFDIRKSKRIMTLDEAISRDSAGYKNLNHVNAKFRVLDHVFNTNGNGIRNAGEFFEHYSLHHGESVAPLAESDAEQCPFKPYSNFKKSYSLVWSKGCIGKLPTDWIEGAIWFYSECRTYFQNGAVGYWGSYNGTVSPDWEKAIARYKTPDITDEEFFAAVTNAYKVEFNGDLPDFLSRRWEIEKAVCMSFIEETLEFLQKELDNRK